MKNSTTLKQIEKAARALKLRLPFSPDCDPAHDLIDRIIDLCSESAQDAALEFLRARHEGVESAVVAQYLVGESWSAIRIPRHQPFGQQIQWCANKGATLVEVLMHINGSDKLSRLTETFSITDFK